MLVGGVGQWPDLAYYVLRTLRAQQHIIHSPRGMIFPCATPSGASDTLKPI